MNSIPSTCLWRTHFVKRSKIYLDDIYVSWSTIVFDSLVDAFVIGWGVYCFYHVSNIALVCEYLLCYHINKRIGLFRKKMFIFIYVKFYLNITFYFKINFTQNQFYLYSSKYTLSID